MASPPRAYSPAGSPPYSHSQLPSSKKRGPAADLSIQPPSMKRRKASTMSVTSIGSAHPLRQTSFPPDEASRNLAYSPSNRRSPSVDNISLVSGSQVSGAPVKKKRGRKSKAERAASAAEAALRDGNDSMVGGRAPSNVSGNPAGKYGDVDGAKEGEGESFEMPENMASTSAARTEKEIEMDRLLRAKLKERFDIVQWNRYETWHRQTLKNADIKRHINSVTSQSCPTSVHQMMQTVCKLFLGDMVESARDIQTEWINLGEKQTDLPDEQENDETISEISKEIRKAPLRPEHLREAFRRRKASAADGGVLGNLMVWNQQTQNGLERFAPRAGGRKLFR
ncbi:histone-fold-containing protein [Xylariomycetidae sp. FL2044]|nr:histone-fold-containing protein [Xylariomycetidae sp. FL2044]